jgi:hypothetical protein
MPCVLQMPREFALARCNLVHMKGRRTSRSETLRLAAQRPQIQMRSLHYWKFPEAIDGPLNCTAVYLETNDLTEVDFLATSFWVGYFSPPSQGALSCSMQIVAVCIQTPQISGPRNSEVVYLYYYEEVLE